MWMLPDADESNLYLNDVKYFWVVFDLKLSGYLFILLLSSFKIFNYIINYFIDSGFFT